MFQQIAYVDGSGNAYYFNGAIVVTLVFVPLGPAQRSSAINLSSQFAGDVEPFIDHDIKWRRQ
jgi:hypothetical protein